ncbi:hypothetical protein CN288_20265 [Bacillus sp. AFS023182]|uniref:hypothetical protein n=1 Tax=Bacillus sp. AFS023182 TaxID=2033492 RepID=UPI000BF64C07|nr:hypothetical protein [Bacillus sp. AFS023182]PFD98909.1 hypothetical protein CN288_20265 [Bacillus sp. AFS023182]
MITKDITKDLKELKINGEEIDFTDASVRLLENTRKEWVNAIESIDVIEWEWQVSVTSYKQNGFEMGVPVDVVAVIKEDDKLIKGTIVLENMETEACSDLYKEELHFIGVSKLDGYDGEVKPSDENVIPSWQPWY